MRISTPNPNPIDDNIWKTITRGVINIAGTWRSLVFGTPSVAQQVEISQSTDGSYVTTLTGKNYYWTNFGSG